MKSALKLPVYLQKDDTFLQKGKIYSFITIEKTMDKFFKVRLKNVSESKEEIHFLDKLKPIKLI
jgi:hypothetical protein